MSYSLPTTTKCSRQLAIVATVMAFLTGTLTGYLLTPSQPAKSTRNRTGLATGEGLTKPVKEVRYEINIPETRKEDASKLYAEVFKSSMEHDRGHFAEKDAKAAVERVYGVRVEIKE